MVQALPQLQSRDYGAGLRQALASAGEYYAQNKQKQSENEAYKTLLDPNASAEQKSAALPKIKDIGAFLKYQTHIGTQNAIDKYEKLAQEANAGGGEGEKRITRLNENAQVTDENVGGQANQDFLGDQTDKTQNIKNPTAPSQIIEKPKDNEVPIPGSPNIDDLLLNIARHNPQLANTLTNIESKKQREKSEQQKISLRKELGEKKLTQGKEIFEAGVKEKHHESHSEFDKTLANDAKAAQNRLHAYAEIEPDLRSGKLDPKRIKNFIANRAAGTQWEGLFSSDEREKLKSSSLYMYDGLKDLFGGQLTDAKLQIASGKVIDPTKSASSNLAVIAFRRYYDESKINERKIADEIKKENGGYRPIDFDVQVRDRMAEKYGAEAKKKMNLALTGGLSDKDVVMMKNKKDGLIYPIPAEFVEEMLGADGEIINE